MFQTSQFSMLYISISFVLGWASDYLVFFVDILWQTYSECAVQIAHDHLYRDNYLITCQFFISFSIAMFFFRQEQSVLLASRS